MLSKVRESIPLNNSLAIAGHPPALVLDVRETEEKTAEVAAPVLVTLIEPAECEQQEEEGYFWDRQQLGVCAVTFFASLGALVLHALATQE